MSDVRTVLEVKDLRKHYPVRKGFMGTSREVLKAVDGVSFSLQMGETLGIVGESGCGKSTLVKTLVRAVDATSGSVILTVDGREIDFATLSGHELKEYRSHMQMIFQDPYSSLNPRMTIQQIVGDPLIVNRSIRRQELPERVMELLLKVGLDPRHLQRYPHAFSGGQRQRIGIARALALDPEIILADEPTSALDVSVQAQILNLLSDLRRSFGMALILISHNLSVVRHLADRVAVMYVGNIVEIAGSDDLFRRPLHPYTEALLFSAPFPDPKLRRERKPLKGGVADISNLPSGCPFHPRCPYAVSVCHEVKPPLEPIDGGGRRVACHRAHSLELQGLSGHSGTVAGV